jgi:hypothetical protein
MLRSASLLAAIASLLCACAASPAPRLVKAAELSRIGSLVPGQPLIIQFEPGETIPVHLKILGPLVRTDPTTPPVRVQVLRRFYLRIDEDGLRTSLDGTSFDASPAQPGSFRFGIGATKHEGMRGEVTIRTPTPSR